MRRAAALLLLLALAAPALAGTLVLPPVVDARDHASHQWLGKAVSFFLSAGLEHNGLPVIPEEEGQALLNRNLVRFPFDITKATAMALAAESGAGTLIWGRVLSGEKRSAPLQLQLFVIDLGAARQRPLPPVKGSFAELFRLQEELLRQLVRAVAPGRQDAIMPQLNMTLPEYERFVKSLLLGDAGKRLELLQPAAGPARRSDFVQYARARASLDAGDPAACLAHLELVSDSPFFRDRREFLAARAEQRAGDGDAALNRFIRLQQRNAFPVATHNDLGALYLLRGDLPLAEKCLRYALYLRRDPGILANLVLLLRAMGRPAAARQELVEALRRFPEDDRLRRLFVGSLAAAENREALGQAFREFVDLPLPGESAPAVEAQFMDSAAGGPVGSDEAPANLAYIEARNLFLESDLEGAAQKAEEALEANPFQAENHHLLALLALQRQEVAEADLFAQSALFLAETLDNFLLQLKVHQAAREREKFRATLERALMKFPQSRELIELGARNR
jgi:Flp pilus assembly protein TadD